MYHCTPTIAKSSAPLSGGSGGGGGGGGGVGGGGEKWIFPPQLLTGPLC